MRGKLDQSDITVFAVCRNNPVIIPWLHLKVNGKQVHNKGMNDKGNKQRDKSKSTKSGKDKGWVLTEDEFEKVLFKVTKPSAKKPAKKKGE